MTDATRLAIGQPCESCGQKIRGLPAIQTQTGYRHTHWMHLKGVPPMSMRRPFTGLPVVYGPFRTHAEKNLTRHIVARYLRRG